MSREFLADVLDKFAQVTSILVETSKIKEYLDTKCDDDRGLKIVLDKTKIQVENLCEHSVTVKDLFYKQYKEVFSKLSAVKIESEEQVNGNVSEQSDALGLDDTASKSIKIPSQLDKPLIKLVDINKLVEPRALIKKDLTPVKENNVQFDNTVVIITSSDEEEVPLKVTKTRLTSKRKAARETIKKTRLSLQIHTSSESDFSDDQKKNKKASKVQNGNRKKLKNTEKVAISDTSSLTDDLSDVESSTKSSTTRPIKKKQDNEVIATNDEWKKDPKFNTKCYVKVLKIPCEKLKEYYLEKLELLEIKKLRDFSSLKKRKRGKNSDTEKSSESDEKEIRKKKTRPNSNLSRNRSEHEESNTSDDDVVASNKSDERVENNQSTNLLPNREENEQAAELALDLLNSDKEDTTPQSDGETETPEENNVETETPEENNVETETPEENNVETETPETPVENNVEAESSAERRETEETPEENNVETSTTEENNVEVKNSEKDNAEMKTPEPNESSDNQNEKPDEVSEDKAEDGEKSKEANEEPEENKDEDKAKKAWRRDKLLTMRLSSSESEEEFQKFSKKKNKLQEEVLSDDEPKVPGDKKKRMMKKRMKKKIISDSDSNKDSGDDFQQQEESSSSSESENDIDKDDEIKKPARKRVKRVRDSSEDDEEEKSTRKQIRNIWGRDSLAETTKQAEAEEKERKARIAEKQKKYNQIYEGNSELNARVEKVVLDFDEKNKKELLKIDDEIVSKLKPHQASGIQFMWDACFESLERAKNTKGSGCILAHCMGLGKTLQVIALTYTLLTNSEETNVRKVMVVSPLNTVLNWVNEYKQWLPDLDDFEIYELVSYKQNYERQYQVKNWHNHGGVLIIGYDMFRNLSNPDNKRISKKLRATFQQALVDPGPDLVICDEGHLLKNEKTNTSIAMNRLRTLRRIVLTGTPLQNNLKEYFCMVQFIKPNLLGTYKEYLNRFVNPITNGQYTDSTPHDIQIMRKRSHVLHKMLDGVVQRRDYSVLQPYLPPKHEYVLFLSLTETQIKLYQHYMDHFARNSSDGSNRTSFLFVDFQALQRICTHPRVLLDKSIEMKMAKEKMNYSDEESEGSLKDFINDDDEEEDSTPESNSSSNEDGGKKSSSNAKKRMTRAAVAAAKENGEELEESVIEIPETQKEWWQEYCDGDELNNISHSSKLFLLFEILKECEQIGDKVLVFSQSLYSLNIIEYFLGRVHDATQAGDTDSVGGYSGSWCLGLDYFRLDGSSSCDNRSIWCKTFNDPSNTRSRLFLISTKAGGLGINLVAANRVIIFDVSWNPSHDIQSIYRVYRFGQTKPCYIYRFVTNGTMEMKIYERQVTKQAISKRVIDEQQIDRHYNQNDLAELYKFDPSPENRPTPLVPKDVLLGEMLQRFENRIYKYHEHQSLLENKEEEGLNEEERKAAWEEFENEKKQRINTGANNYLAGYMTGPNIGAALMSIVRKENPSWTDEQIKLMIPTLHLQLQEQVAKGDLTMYRRLQQEIQILHALQNQRLKEQFYQQQALRLLQQQQQQMNPGIRNPNAGSYLDQYINQMPGPSRAHLAAQTSGLNSNEVIELND